MNILTPPLEEVYRKIQLCKTSLFVRL